MKKTYENSRNNKGITLVALVITIIVLLILAGITISLTLGENGLLNRAEGAKAKTEEASVKEEIEFAIHEILIEKYPVEKLTIEKIAGYLPEKLEGLVITDISDNKITGEYKKYVFEIDTKFNVKIVGKVSGIVTYTLTPKGYTKEDVIITIQVEFNNGESIVSLTPQSEGIEIVEEKAKFKVTQNGIYEFKLIDSNQKEKDIIIPINTIDRNEPKITLEIDEKTNYINGNVKAKVILQDEESGIDLEKSRWIINQSNAQLGNELTAYTGSFDSETQEIKSEKVTMAGGTYYIHVLALDKAGNHKEIISDAIVVKNGYAISTPQDLQNIKNDVAGSYYVINDIDMSGFDFKPIGNTYDDKFDFRGNIDGQGYTISNLSIKDSSNDTAIFRGMKGNITIKNLLIKNVNISSSKGRVAVFAGGVLEMSNTPFSVLFKKVGITGNVKGDGKLAAFVADSSSPARITFEDCYARVNLLNTSPYDAAAFTNNSQR